MRLNAVASSPTSSAVRDVHREIAIGDAARGIDEFTKRTGYDPGQTDPEQHAEKQQCRPRERDTALQHLGPGGGAVRGENQLDLADLFHTHDGVSFKSEGRTLATSVNAHVRQDRPHERDRIGCRFAGPDREFRQRNSGRVADYDAPNIVVVQRAPECVLDFAYVAGEDREFDIVGHCVREQLTADLEIKQAFRLQCAADVPDGSRENQRERRRERNNHSKRQAVARDTRSVHRPISCGFRPSTFRGVLRPSHSAVERLTNT
jgi:hypothetical protein